MYSIEREEYNGYKQFDRTKQKPKISNFLAVLINSEHFDNNGLGPFSLTYSHIITTQHIKYT